MAQTFFVDDEVHEKTALDAVVTVVDALHLPSKLANSPKAAEQISFADVVRLNKVDLESTEQLAELKLRIASINSFAKILHSNHCDVPLDKLLDLGFFDLERIMSLEPGFLT